MKKRNKSSPNERLVIALDDLDLSFWRDEAEAIQRLCRKGATVERMASAVRGQMSRNSQCEIVAMLLQLFIDHKITLNLNRILPPPVEKPDVGSCILCGEPFADNRRYNKNKKYCIGCLRKRATMRRTAWRIKAKEGELCESDFVERKG